MMIMVASGRAVARRCMTRAAVSASSALLNSSRSRIEPGRSSARAMAMRCACPSLSPPPASSQGVSRPWGRSKTKSAAAMWRASAS